MKKIEYKSLDHQVLVVAVEGAVKDWAAYIGSVPGNNHFNEKELVAQEGTKLDEKLAAFLFPDWAKAFTWRN